MSVCERQREASLDSSKLIPFFFFFSSQSSKQRQLHLESSLQLYYLKIGQHTPTTITEILEVETSTAFLLRLVVSVAKFTLASLRL